MSLLIESLTGGYTPHGLERDATFVLAFAFGRSKDDKGLTNEAIGHMAILKSQEIGIPIFAQFSVANVIEEAGYECTRIDPENENELKYMSTGKVIEKVERIVDFRSEVALVIAQSFHAPRADAETAKRGLNTVLPEDLPNTWSPDSIFMESHCRNRIFWSLREPIVIAINKLKGNI